MQWDFKKLQIGAMVNVQAYKHDGFLYRQWTNAKVIFHNKKHVVLALRGTRVLESRNSAKGWKYKDDAIWFLPKRSLYNTIVLLKKGVGSLYYTNIASYPIFEDNTIKFIDYDLDLKSYPNKDLQIVDKEEFKTNSNKFNYSHRLKEKIFNEITEVVNLYNNEAYFFNEEIILYYLNIMLKDKLIDEKNYNSYYQMYHKNYSEETEMMMQLRNFKTKKY
ncbi:hypothetical protein BCF59_0427 [Mycoplasmopsis mustelae]|uniref:DUF402 domain-containing protein n=1 Tax=Mycoplasmopsis mustelae TaxID=171289 RepID=A0A4R7UEF3_9BACT|nr:DUF402 domain-containing protein [Mycoplasmopsis mustelae]TDV24456.1 hypothetical protein BCF59_0427 [Mycoplasmopsis mustelae]